MLNIFIFQGGFANQLYQLNYLKTELSNRRSILLIDATHYSMLGTQRELSAYVNESCKDYKFSRNNIFNLFLIFLCVLLRKVFRNSEVFKLGFITIYFGYFQQLHVSKPHVMHFLKEWKRHHDTRSCTEADCVLHIRLGDYLLAKNKLVHGITPVGYYLDGIGQFSKLGAKNFILVSDSKNELDDYLKKFKSAFPDLKFFVTKNEDVESDFNLMLNANFFIGANSTLSAWACYLRAPYTSSLPRNWSVSESAAEPFIPEAVYRL